MLEGVRNQTITQERLDEAVTRILGLKAALQLPEKQASGDLVPSLEVAKKIIVCAEHLAMARACANKSVTLIKNKENILPLTPEKNRRILLRVINNQPGYQNTYDEPSLHFKKRLEEKGFIVTDYDLKYVPMLNVSKNTVKELKEQFDLILYLVNIGMPGEYRFNRIMWKNGMQYDVPKFSADIPEMMISLYNPYHLMDAQMVPVYINAYSPTDIVVDAVIDKITGSSEFIGVSPVDAYCGLWDTRL